MYKWNKIDQLDWKTVIILKALKKDLLAFDGGDPSVLDPCEVKSDHGLLGLGVEVVSAVASWMKGGLGPEWNGYRWFSSRKNKTSEIEEEKVSM